MKKIYHQPFNIKIPVEMKNSALELAERLIEFLSSFGNVYVRMAPIVHTQINFSTGEQEAFLRMRIGLEPLDKPGRMLGTLTNPYEAPCYETSQETQKAV
jgi:hypothetical protein